MTKSSSKHWGRTLPFNSQSTVNLISNFKRLVIFRSNGEMYKLKIRLLRTQYGFVMSPLAADWNVIILFILRLPSTFSFTSCSVMAVRSVVIALRFLCIPLEIYELSYIERMTFLFDMHGPPQIYRTESIFSVCLSFRCRWYNAKVEILNPTFNNCANPFRGISIRLLLNLAVKVQFNRILVT